jgi:hypothetical protein
METLIGAFGAFIILAAFLLNQKKILNNDTFLYDFINFVGSVLMIIYAILLKSYPFLVLNTIWALSSLVDVVNYLRKRYGK